MEQIQPLLHVCNVVKEFPIYRGVFQHKTGAVHAVNGVSFDIYRGETLGLVGESGCGKTTVGRTILRLYEPTSGSIHFENVDLQTLKGEELRKIRRKMQMIFQDPYSSLNPRMKVRSIIAEPVVEHGLMRWNEVDDLVAETLNLVKLNPGYGNRFPHEFSGGQRQRIGIARVLTLRPDFIVCDEPISALDVSVQAQIVNLLIELQEKFNLTYLFIMHDLAMVRHISNRIGVMYLGCLAELAQSDELYENPLHPYSKALLSAIPIPDADVEAGRKRIILRGDVPNPINPPTGCHFRTRCYQAKSICSNERPEWRMVSPGHWVACHFV